MMCWNHLCKFMLNAQCLFLLIFYIIFFVTYITYLYSRIYVLNHVKKGMYLQHKCRTKTLLILLKLPAYPSKTQSPFLSQRRHCLEVCVDNAFFRHMCIFSLTVCSVVVFGFELYENSII